MLFGINFGMTDMSSSGPKESAHKMVTADAGCTDYKPNLTMQVQVGPVVCSCACLLYESMPISQSRCYTKPQAASATANAIVKF